MAKANAEPVSELTTLSFEQILERLSGVVEQLEDGEIPLEQALSTFEQGIALSRLGQKRLDEAERRIELLLQDEGQAPGQPARSSAAPRTTRLQSEEDGDDE